jgi:hypothetical protein
VLIGNVGSQRFTVTNSNLEVRINSNAGCRGAGQNIAYEATVDVPGDGFGSNDTDVEKRTTS